MRASRLKEISSGYSGTCRIGDHAVPHVRDYNDSGPKPRTEGWETIDNALGRRQRTWFPEMIVRLRAEWREGMSIPTLIDLRNELDRNTSPDSDQPEHPYPDHPLPQVWADWACCRTTSQRARLDPGAGPVRSRVERSNPRAGKRMGSILQATSTGRRRKGLGRGCGKLSALKIAGGFPAHRRQFGSNPCPLEHADGLREPQADFWTGLPRCSLAEHKPTSR